MFGRRALVGGPCAVLGLVLAVLVVAVFGLRGLGSVPPAVGDTTLSGQLASVPPVDLRGPDNPVFDPRVLNDFWDSATVRAATPLVARPAAAPLVASPPASAEGPLAPSLPALLQGALLARGPVRSGSQGGRPRPPVLRASPDPVPTVAAAPDLPVRDGQVLAARVTGRLFFTLAGQPRSCTATVISSGSGSILATAGHCLLADLESTPAGQSRAQVANLLFGPGFHDGLFPYGRWAVTSVHIAAGWRNGSAWAQDVGFLRVPRAADGRTVQDVVGAAGVVFTDRDEPVDVALLGYPAVAPFDGSHLRWCATAAPSVGDPVDPAGVAVPCAMTPGYSGGPLLAGYDAASGSGYLAGVASHDYGRGILYAAHLGQDALAAFLEADQP